MHNPQQLSNSTQQPYTYLIGWAALDKWYYGCRFSKTCHPTDLWVKYFTSSAHVSKFRILHGDPDVVQIRQVFMDPNKCREVEHIVLRRLKVVNNSRWLNQTDNKSISSEAAQRSHANRLSRRGVPNPAASIALKGRIPWNKGLRGDPRSLEGSRAGVATRRLNDNYHAWNKGIPMAEEQKQKMRDTKHTPEHCENISKATCGRTAHNKGVPMSEEQKQKMRKAKQGKQFEKKTCPHCGRVGGGPNMTRSHFDNCKLKFKLS